MHSKLYRCIAFFCAVIYILSSRPAAARNLLLHALPNHSTESVETELVVNSLKSHVLSNNNNVTYSPGLRAYWIWGVSHATNLGQVDWDEYSQITIVGDVNWPLTQNPFFAGAPSSDFALKLTGRITVPSGGLWRFSMSSDEAASLTINNTEVIYDGTRHSYRTVDGYISLGAGSYDFELRFLERGWTQGLVLKWAAPGQTEEIVPASAFSYPDQPPAANTTTSIKAYWSTGQSHANTLGQVDWYKYDHVSDVDNISWKQTQGAFYVGGPSSDFACRFLANITIPQSGSWTFNLGSDEAAALLIDGQEVIYDGTRHSYRWKAHTLTLTAGQHAIEVRYLERGWLAGLHLTWKGPSVAHEQIVPPSAFSTPNPDAFGTSGNGGFHTYWQSGVSHANTLGQVDWNIYDTDSLVGSISYKLTQGSFWTNGPSSDFAGLFLGSITIPENGTWTFGLGSDEAASLIIDGQTVAYDPTRHSYRWKSGSISLSQGVHSVEIRFLERGWLAGLHLTWQGPSDAHESIVPASAVTPGTFTGSNQSQTNGLTAYWTTGVSHANTLGQIDWNDYTNTSTVDRVNWRLTQGAFYSGGPSSDFALRLMATIDIPADGDWTFNLGSDEAAALYIDGNEVIYDGNRHSYRWQSATVTLTSGQHTYEIRYLERGWLAGLVATWRGPTVPNEEVIPTSAFTPATFTRDATQGVRAFWTNGVSHATNLGQIDWYDNTGTTLEENISWRLTQGAFYSGGPSSDFASRIFATLAVPQTGTWTFNLGSDEAAALLIDGNEVIYDGSRHSYRWKSGSVVLTAGNHTIEVRHLERGWLAGLFLTWQGPGVTREEVIPASALTPGTTADFGSDGNGSLAAFWSTGVGHANSLGQVDWSQYTTTTSEHNISYRLTQGAFYLNGPSSDFAGRFLGTITIPQTGTWTFNLGSDEAAELLIDGSLVVYDDTRHSYRWKSGSVVLSQGDHTIEVRYLERGWLAGMFLTWRGPNDTHESVIPSSAFSPGTFPTYTGNGINATWYYSNASALGSVAWGNPIATSIHDNVAWKLTQGSFWTGGRSSDFAGSIKGTLIVPNTGTYVFNLGSDEAASLTIDGSSVVNDGVRHSFRWNSNSVYLTAGNHPIEIKYLERGWLAGLVLTWKGPGDAHENVISPDDFVSNSSTQLTVVRWQEKDPGQ